MYKSQRKRCCIKIYTHYEQNHHQYFIESTWMKFNHDDIIFLYQFFIFLCNCFQINFSFFLFSLSWQVSLVELQLELSWIWIWIWNGHVHCLSRQYIRVETMCFTTMLILRGSGRLHGVEAFYNHFCCSHYYFCSMPLSCWWKLHCIFELHIKR